VIFIDCLDGTTLVPFMRDILKAAEIAKREKGRLRVPLGALKDVGGDTRAMAVGCLVLGDYREETK